MKSQIENQPALTGNSSSSIPTFVVNLKKRTDRKKHVLKEFKERTEFRLTIVEAFEHSFGALGLWATIRHILTDLIQPDTDYVIICEDDIQFTEYYSKEKLFQTIIDAQRLNADLLLGGVSWLDDAIQISEHLFWTNNFTGLQFTVVFKNFINTLKTIRMPINGAVDLFLASQTNNILLRHPFFSIQKEFGYSDATPGNSEKGKITSFFSYSDLNLSELSRVKNIYKSLRKNDTEIQPLILYDNIKIPTYVINLPERTDRLSHIKAEFENRSEFDIMFIQACKHEVGALGLWLSIRNVIKIAIANDDDVIIVCEDDHQFTHTYTKEFLIKNIIEANDEGAYLLSGGAGKFQKAIPITENRYWVRHLLSTQFMVIYKDFFQIILDEPFDENIVADLAYSRMTPHKMLLYPFISTQKDFGYSDITDIHNEQKDLVTNMFRQSSLKLGGIQQAYIKYKLQNIENNQ